MNGPEKQLSAIVSVTKNKHIDIYTLIWEAMPELAMTSFKECLYAEDAADNKTFCLLSMSALQHWEHHSAQHTSAFERTPFRVTTQILPWQSLEQRCEHKSHKNLCMGGIFCYQHAHLQKGYTAVRCCHALNLKHCKQRCLLHQTAMYLKHTAEPAMAS